MKKLICVLTTFLLLLAIAFVPVEAAESFTWSKFDSGYVTIVFDDGRDCTATLARIFTEKNIPLSCAITGKSVVNSVAMVSVLKNIQNHGGEILSHTYSHNAFDENSTLEEIEKEFSMSYNALTNAGFVVNGIIEAGAGGSEKSVNYDLVEQAVKKYYKYSDCYGTSLQYNSVRTYMRGQSLSQLKTKVSRAAQRKEWLILFAHDFSEISQSDLEALLDYINETEGVKGVTYKYMYENFGNYPTKQDFGKTYYTVSYTDKKGTVIEEKVVAAGSYVSSKPSKIPEGTTWSNTEVIVEDNMIISALKGEVISTPSTSNPSTSNPSTSNPSTSNPSTSNPSASNPSASNPSASTPTTNQPSDEPQDNSNNDKAKDPITLWIVIGIAGVALVVLIIVIIVVCCKNKKMK